MVRIDDSDAVTKCWLSQDELTRLERVAGADGWTREIAIQLMGRCGLRASEVSYPRDAALRWSEDGATWLFEVRGKNTKGGARTTRDAWMPDEVADDIRKYTRERGLATTDPWVDASTPSVRRWVKEAAEVIAEETDNGRWQQVSSFGRFLDPIADKLLVAAVLMMLVATDRVATVSVLPALVILCREILVSGLREHLAELKVSVPVSRLAKWKTAIQMAALVVLLVGNAGPAEIPVRLIGEVGLWVAGLLTIVTGYDYMQAGLAHMLSADRDKA